MSGSDRDALCCIFEFTRGKERWYNKNNWLSNVRTGLWYGVVMEAGHVLRLNLNSNRLEGIIPNNDRLKSLVNLAYLSLSSNLIYGKEYFY